MPVRPAVVLTLSYFAPGDTNVFAVDAETITLLQENFYLRLASPEERFSRNLQKRKHVPQHRSYLPEPNFYRLDTEGFPSLEIAHAIRYRRKARQNHRPHEMYKGKPEIRLNAAEQLEVE